MEPAGEALLHTFDELRRFVMEDLERIVSQDVGGNYAVGALVGCCYEMLGRLRGEDAHSLFAESLPDEWKSVASSLFNSLRNGLVHSYAPKVIRVGPGIQVAISWREVAHLSWVGDRVVLRAPDLVQGLELAWARSECVLREHRGAREYFAKAIRRERVVPVLGADEKSAWIRLLAARPGDA